MKSFKIIKIVLMITVFFSVISAVVMQLWNWLMPDLFGLPTITFWKAAGLLLLSKLIFSGGFRKGHYGQTGPPWRNHWKQKWQNMPMEKREKWKQRFADKWCSPEQKPSVHNTQHEENQHK